MITTLIPAPYLYIGLFTAGLAAGGYGVHTWYKAERADAVDTAMTTEHTLQRSANQADTRYVDQLHDQVKRAEDSATAFRRALNAKNKELAACRVNAELLGVLDDAGKLPGAPRDPAEPRPAAPRAAAAPDSGCDVELDRCRANYAEVCVPNAVHVLELRAFTRSMIRDYNRAVGRE